MNDPDPRHTSDGFDHDAIFADIVAHLNDEAVEPLRAAEPFVVDGESTTDGDDARPNPVDGDAIAGNLLDGTRGTDGTDTTQGGADGTDGTDLTEGGTDSTEVAESAADLPSPQVWRAHEVDDDLEEHFVPLPLAPLPVGDLQFWAIIIGMCGGPLLLLYLVLFDRGASSLWVLAAIGMSIGGFALLVSRMPGHDGDDDDGARL
jgi:hypothetical protein